MKKHALMFLCALLGFVCVFSRERIARRAQAKKFASGLRRHCRRLTRKRFARHVKYLSSDELEGRGTGASAAATWRADYIGKTVCVRTG